MGTRSRHESTSTIANTRITKKQMGHETMVLLGSRNANNRVRVQGRDRVHAGHMKKQTNVVSDIQENQAHQNYFEKYF